MALRCVALRLAIAGLRADAGRGAKGGAHDMRGGRLARGWRCGGGRLHARTDAGKQVALFRRHLDRKSVV